MLEILASTGVTAGSGNAWNLIASGQANEASGCVNIAGFTRVFRGTNCQIAGPAAPVFDVIAPPTTDLPGPPNDTAPGSSPTAKRDRPTRSTTRSPARPWGQTLRQQPAGVQIGNTT